MPTTSGSSIEGYGILQSSRPAGHDRRLNLVRIPSLTANLVVLSDELLRRGVGISEPFHDAGGIFHHAGAEGLISGPNPQRKSYASYALFSDPDGNGWVFQEVTVRLTGHIEAGDKSFTPELTNAVRRAKAGKRRRDGTGDLD